MDQEQIPNLNNDNTTIKQILLSSNEKLDTIISVSVSTNDRLNDFIDVMKNSKLDDLEKERESKVGNKKHNDAKAHNRANALGVGGILNTLGIGKAIGSIGAGIGAALPIVLPILAVGAAVIGTIKIMESLDADKVKKNVETLLSIGEDYESALDMLGESGVVATSLAGLGIGLAAFGIGSGINATIDKFLEPDWAQAVKDNVNVLLSIGDGYDNSLEMLKEGGTLAIMLGGLGVALAAFGVGSGVAAAVDKFSGGDFAEGIKKNVETLLSIDAMGGENNALEVSAGLYVLGGALAAFAVGNAASSILNFFSGSNVDNIVNDVQSLLSITGEDNIAAKAAEFETAMKSISSGLVSLSMGNAASGAIDSASSFLTFWSGENSSIKMINDNMADIINVMDRIDVQKSADFKVSMANMSDGLTSLAQGQFVSSVSSLVDSFFSFFSGSESPMQLIFDIADRSDEIDRGAVSIAALADALNSLSNFSDFVGFNFDFEEFSKDIAAATKIMDSAIHGGEVSLPGLGNDYTIEHGLANDTISYEAAANNVRLIMDSLKIQPPEFQYPSTNVYGGQIDRGLVPTSVDSYERVEREVQQTNNEVTSFVDNRTYNNSSSQTSMMIPQAPTIDLMDGGA